MKLVGDKALYTSMDFSNRKFCGDDLPVLFDG